MPPQPQQRSGGVAPGGVGLPDAFRLSPLSQSLEETRSRADTDRMIGGGVVGALIGFLVGNWMYGEKCYSGFPDDTCYRAQDAKVYLLAVIGLVVGLLVARLVLALRFRLRDMDAS